MSQYTSCRHYNIRILPAKSWSRYCEGRITIALNLRLFERSEIYFLQRKLGWEQMQAHAYGASNCALMPWAAYLWLMMEQIEIYKRRISPKEAETLLYRIWCQNFRVPLAQSLARQAYDQHHDRHLDSTRSDLRKHTIWAYTRPRVGSWMYVQCILH